MAEPRATGPLRRALGSLARDRAAVVSAVLLLLFVVAGLGAPLWIRLLSGFGPEEMHPAFALAPPGARDVPLAHPRYDGDRAAFALVDLDGDGWLLCHREPAAGEAIPLLPWLARRWPVVHDELLAGVEKLEATGVPVRESLRLWTGPLVCPELDALAESWRRDYRDLLVRRDGADGSPPDGALSAAELAGADGVEFSALDLDGDGVLTLDELRQGTRHLRFEPARLLAEHDADGDLRISPAEFPGLPELRAFHLGADALGRDVLSRLLYGARVSLFVGVAATLIAVLIGITYGVVAGWAGRLGDELMMRFVDVLYALPFPLLVILAVVVLGTGVLQLVVLLGLVGWMTLARVVRGQVRSLRRAPFVQAAEAYGASRTAILGHLLRNAVGPVLAYATLLVPVMILDEAFLSFLGLGVPSGLPSWGLLIAEGADQLHGQPWLIAAPALALALTLYAFHYLGDGLRRALAPGGLR